MLSFFEKRAKKRALRKILKLKDYTDQSLISTKTNRKRTQNNQNNLIRRAFPKVLSFYDDNVSKVRVFVKQITV